MLTNKNRAEEETKMKISAAMNHLMLALFTVFALSFCSMAGAEEASQNPPAEQPKSSEAAAPVKSAPAAQGSLTFFDDQQTWRDSEMDSYRQWMKDNPRYSHPMFQSQWNQQHGSNFIDSRPDPYYRPWSYNVPWYNRGAVSHVRGRTLWVNPRYPTGKYYGQSAEAQTEQKQPAAETAAPAAGK